MKLRPLLITGALLFGEDTLDQTCTHNIVFLYPNRTKVYVPGTAPLIAAKLDQPYSASYNACFVEYCTVPCTEWKFASTVSDLPLPEEFINVGFPTLHYVEYPLANDILVMTEVRTQSWETIIGNIGGIIGLWLGASVLSLLQLFYLCCFSNCDGCCVWTSSKGGGRSSVSSEISICSSARPLNVERLSKFPYNF